MAGEMMHAPGSDLVIQLFEEIALDFKSAPRSTLAFACFVSSPRNNGWPARRPCTPRRCRVHLAQECRESLRGCETRRCSPIPSSPEYRPVLVAIVPTCLLPSLTV